MAKPYFGKRSLRALNRTVATTLVRWKSTSETVTPGGVDQALECGGGAHEPGLLDLVDLAAPNQGTTRARPADAVCAGLFAGLLETTAKRIRIGARP